MCAGIAARLGIDPIIVRGVFVVAALFGLPMFIVYAVGWAVLPDLMDRIHFRELLRRRFDPAIVGIAIMLLIGFFPVVPWFFAVVLPFGYLVPGGWFDWSPWGVLSTLLAVTVIGGLIFLIARASSHRAPTAGVPPVPDPRTASANPQAPGSPAATLDYSGVPAPATADPAADLVSPAGSAPPPVASTATDAEIAVWREQHAAWKAQDDAWRRQLQDVERAARQRAREERAAAGAIFAAEAAERRRVRRESRPRTSFGFVVFTIGAALVVGALSALGFGSAEPDEPAIAVAIGLFAGALVFGLAMIVAGALRRRSGFLAFVAVTLLVVGAATAAVPITRGIAFGYTYVTNYEGAAFTQPWGDLTIDIHPVGANAQPIAIEKRAGDTYINVEPGVILTLDVISAHAVEWSRWDWSTGQTLAEGSWSGRPTDDGRHHVQRRVDNSVTSSSDVATRQTITLDQLSGTVYVTLAQP